MWYMLKAELKNHILNLRFWAGVLLILAAALVSEQTHLQFLLDSGGSREGPGWFLAYSFCSGGEHTLLFVPIAVTFAAGGEAEQELHSRFALFSCVRTGKKQYLAGKAAGLILSGGLMLSVSMLLMLGISVLVFGDIPVLGGGGPAFSTVLLQVLVSFPRGFLNGALWAMAGGFAAIVTRSRYLAYAVPFVLYYVLSVFQERYFRRFLFLNPRYWMAPVYFNDLICILILLALCALTGFLFIRALKRRLDDA
ncbi:ABC transporter permease [Schaedlerella arabinosiphila]|uniref:ABC transporter permease n=2 Tax=Schaedlerella arabinosiphila TaxID=2044587 RepID=A0A426DRC4_9FIRM|nr:ABC transporter permease [Schaedlerella arabinosiphila]